MAALASDWLRHFQLLLWNRWTEFNKTWQEARSQRLLQSLCFLGQSEKQNGRPGLWLAETFSTSPLKPLNGIQWNLTGSKISTSSTRFLVFFFWPIGKTKWPPWILIGWDIFDFSSVTAERNSTKLDRKQDLSVFFGPIRKIKWPTWPLIGWDIFDFSSETAEWNSTKVKWDLNILYLVCVFRADRKNKMAALVSHWLRLFDFSSETIEWNSTKVDRKQDLNILYHVCVFWPISKQKWPPWPIRQKGSTLYSGARYVALWGSCFVKGGILLILGHRVKGQGQLWHVAWRLPQNTGSLSTSYMWRLKVFGQSVVCIVPARFHRKSTDIDIDLCLWPCDQKSRGFL